ncbi:MAG: hypothetical protein ABI197_09345 [Granulicella sp.]
MSKQQWTARGLQLLIGALVLLYAADWAYLRARISRGTAFQTVQVHQFIATPLKGQKEEFDYDGDVATTCSSALFPQAGNPPCWWLKRHTSHWE